MISEGSAHSSLVIVLRGGRGRFATPPWAARSNRPSTNQSELKQSTRLDFINSYYTLRVPKVGIRHFLSGNFLLSNFFSGALAIWTARSRFKPIKVTLKSSKRRRIIRNVLLVDTPMYSGGYRIFVCKKLWTGHLVLGRTNFNYFLSASSASLLKM